MSQAAVKRTELLTRLRLAFNKSELGERNI
jgi:hypothetical protein